MADFPTINYLTNKDTIQGNYRASLDQLLTFLIDRLGEDGSDESARKALQILHSDTIIKSVSVNCTYDDCGKNIVFIGDISLTATLDTLTDLKAGWYITIINDTTTTIEVIPPNNITIDGNNNKILQAGERSTFICDGVKIYSTIGTITDKLLNIFSTLNNKSDITHTHNELYSLLSHIHNTATTSSNGFMSSIDKTKLDNIEEGSNKSIASDITPIESSIGTIGTSLKYARADHIHPSDTSKSDIDHLHTGIYSEIDHDHDTIYSKLNHTHTTATTSIDGYMSKEDKSKLDGIESNAEVNDTPSELLTKLKTVDGSNSGLDADLLDGYDSSYFSISTHIHDKVSGTTDGYMSKEDKIKLDNISTEATKVILSNTTPSMNSTGSSGTSIDASRADHVHPSDTTKSNINHTHTGVYSLIDHTHNLVTSSSNGLMSSADKSKLDLLSTSITEDVTDLVIRAEDAADLATTKAELATDKASAASISATNAYTSETNASTSETTTLGYKNDTSALKQDVINIKNSIETTASQVSSDKTLVLQYKDAASASATNAATSESNASTYANNALTSANNASASESTVLEYKESAEASATLASSKATTATEQATIATTKATQITNLFSDMDAINTAVSNASTSATNAATSESNSLTYKNDTYGYLTTVQGLASQVSSNKTSVDNSKASIDSTYTSITTLYDDLESIHNDTTTVNTLASQVSADASQVSSDKTIVSSNLTTIQSLASQVSSDKDQVSSDKTNASSSASAASVSASQALTYKNNASTYASNAAASASAASDSAIAAAEAALTATVGQVNVDWNSTSGLSQILNKPIIPSTTSQLTNDSNFVIDSNVVHNTGSESISGNKTFTNLVSLTYSTGTGGNASLECAEAIISGYDTTTAYSGFFNKRKCSNDEGFVNVAGFFVNSDGSAKFLHRRTWNGKDDSYINFNATKLIYGTSGTPGVAANEEYNIYHSGNLIIDNYVLKSSLSTVATSGSYNDLLNKPTITVTFDGLQNKPTTLAGYGITDAASISSLNTHINNISNPHGVTKSQIGLGNVDNTSDANKPISTSVQTALNLKANISTTYTKTEVDTLINAKDSLPSQSDNNGKVLMTNGTTASWSDIVLSVDLVSIFNSQLDTVINNVENTEY